MSDLPSEEGERKFSRHNVIAVYPSVEQAREAITHLERHGVEGGDIELLGAGAEGAAVPQTNIEQREADMAVTGSVAKRSLAGMPIGALVGAVVVGLASLLPQVAFDVGDSAAAVVIGGAVAGAFFGAFAGLFYGGATGLPVSDAWGETFEAVKQGSTAVAVHSDDSEETDKAVKALESMGGHTRLARFGPDGRTTDV